MERCFSPVAAVEARRSRSPSVADDVALMEVPGRKKRGAQSLVGTIQGNLMRVPIGNFFAQIYESACDPNIPTGGTIRDSCYKLRYKRGRERQSSMVIYQWLNELGFESRRPHHTNQGLSQSLLKNLSGLPFSGSHMATNPPISRRSGLCISRKPTCQPLAACARATRPCACQFARSVQRHDH
jgi:hypothetical protein